ncbi:nicotinamide-nucleotide adenylyltransferase [Maudiozyma humilis]|uniref:Nicotinamide-nucleotide adenylyltransferase n=1 Tax=Maudiozyma humilis TaxID=51915 RepID=A0AAV5S2C8_MAUHU|nr:nicotinamide-nucleotide adenylyltransferase [Kazachstania humilis]
MDPTKAPDFKPPSPNEELVPPPDPRSTIPNSDPIVPYVLADYNDSIDAPFNLDTKKKNMMKKKMKHLADSNGRHRHRSQHIPLNSADFQPLSADISSADSDEDDYDEDGSRHNSNSIDEALKAIDIGVKKYQIADLEEVPHGIVRQARDFEQYEFPTHRFAHRLEDPNKLPLVIVACGSFSPITYLHLRMFEMALDAINEQTRFEVVGGYFSPVNDTYQKAGLAPAYNRVRMCELACERTSSWLMVDAWESLQSSYTRTAKVLDHFNHEINVKRGGVVTASGEKVGCKIMLLAGGDLIESMGEPNVWADADLHHILGNYGCLIVERTGSDVRSFLLSHDIMYEHRRNVLVIKQLIYNDISSTKVRLFIRRGMSVQYLLPNSVIRYIQEHKLYINQTEPVKQVMGGKE